MWIAFKRRNISSRTDITHSLSSKSSEWSYFAHSWACLHAKSGVHSIRRVKCNRNSVYTSKYLQQDWYNAQFSSKSSIWSHFSHRSLCFDDETVVHSIRRVKSKEIAFKRRNISNRTDITHSFLQNRVNGRILHTVGLESALKTACISFGV